MAVPYERTGRSRQKQRTRASLLEAARALLADGFTPSVEQVADAAGISRTTAYRYFPNQRELLLAAIPVIDRDSQLTADASNDVGVRVRRVVEAQLEILRTYEPQLRMALALSLDQPRDGAANTSPLRAGRAIDWFLDALSPLEHSHPQLDRRRLAVAIRACCGIESWIWLTDVARATPDEAAEIMRTSARALLSDAMGSGATGWTGSGATGSSAAESR